MRTVAACDIVIASDRSRFGQPEIKLGVFPPAAAVLLPLVIGEKRARELILTGEIIDSLEAGRLGLCNHVVPGAHLEPKLLEVLAKLRSSLAPRWHLRDNRWTSVAAGRSMPC